MPIILLAVRLYLNVLTFLNPKKGGQKAFEIFSKPRRGRLTDGQKSYLAKAKQEILFFENTPIQVYFWEGVKPPVLLLHGWESNAARWQPLISALKKAQYAIVALDAPAHGASGSQYFNPVLYANMVHEVVKKYQPTTIVGHSVGGYTVAYYLQYFEHPSLSKAIIMATVSDNSVVFDTYLNYIKVNQKVHAAFYNFVENRLGGSPKELSAANFARNFDEKALIIHDTADELIPIDNSIAIHENWKDSTFIRTEGLGHRLRDKQIDKYIVDFIIEA